MQFDCSKYDGLIFIGSNLRESVWVTQSHILGSRSDIRTAGRMRKTAPNHTLLGVALTAALRGISDNHIAAKLIRGRSDRAKPKIMVRSFDPTFESYIRSLPFVQSNLTVERALQFQLGRFEISFDSTEQDRSLNFTLVKWASLNVLNADDIGDDTSLVPSLVSAMSSNRQSTGTGIRS